MDRDSQVKKEKKLPLTQIRTGRGEEKKSDEKKKEKFCRRRRT